jgi:hypothetical protein
VGADVAAEGEDGVEVYLDDLSVSVLPKCAMELVEYTPH